MEAKNPAHVDALSKGDLTKDRQIIVFNRESGAIDEYIVVSPPQPVPPTGDRTPGFGVELRPVWGGETELVYLMDMGVIPLESGQWRETVFTVDRHNKHHLPPARPTWRSGRR